MNIEVDYYEYKHLCWIRDEYEKMIKDKKDKDCNSYEHPVI